MRDKKQIVSKDEEEDVFFSRTSLSWEIATAREKTTAHKDIETGTAATLPTKETASAVRARARREVPKTWLSEKPGRNAMDVESRGTGKVILNALNIEAKAVITASRRASW